MKAAVRPLVITVLLFAVHAMAQSSQPGPESTNQNRNEPSIHIQGQASPSGAENSSTQPAQDQQPQTQILPAADAPGSADPLLAPPPLPKGDTTLVGGIAEKIDPVRNRVRLRPFGGGKRMDIRFDDRSHFYHDGRETTVLGIKKGDRVYADTMLVDGKIFARNLRVQTESGPAEARGQITQYDSAAGIVTLQDQLTSQPVRFAVSSKTAVARDNVPTTLAELRPGTVVDVLFAPQGATGAAERIDILALPGANYLFSGRVTNVDLRSGTLSVANQSDNKHYDIHFDPSKVDQLRKLVVGAEVEANTVFDGRGYTAQKVTVNPPTSAQQ